MLATRVMPCLLLDDGALVKSVKFKNLSYIGDPINAIRIYNELEVDELILLDITASEQGRKPDFELVKQVASECFMPLTYGGGISSLDDAKHLFNLGIEKISLNSAALNNPQLIEEISKNFGSQSVVISIDASKKLIGGYKVCSHRGQTRTKITPEDHAFQVQERGAGEILITSVDQDGTWDGYDLELIQKVTSRVTVPVIANGGAGKVEDFGKAVNESSASALATGSMVIYQKKDLGVLINFPSQEKLASVLELI